MNNVELLKDKYFLDILLRYTKAHIDKREAILNQQYEKAAKARDEEISTYNAIRSYLPDSVDTTSELYNYIKDVFNIDLDNFDCVKQLQRHINLLSLGI